MKHLFSTMAAVAAGVVCSASADMRLEAIFGDHAVIQRDKTVAVWGDGAKAADWLELSLGRAKATAIANPDGTFRFRLPAQDAGGPYELVVSNATSGATLVSRDVYVGEVWLASGQSNMQFSMDDAKPGFENPELPLLRRFSQPHKCGYGYVPKAGAVWAPTSAQTIGDFTAVGAFFGRALQTRLGCAVGIVDNSWGGTRVETWTSRSALMTHPVTRRWTLDFERSLGDAGRWAEKARSMGGFPRDPGIDAKAKDWMTAAASAADWTAVTLPGRFAAQFGRMFNGAVWYRRTVEIPSDWAGRALKLNLGRIDKQDQVWFEGERVGGLGTGDELHFWNVQRTYDVPARLVKGGKATIAVRVWSQVAAGGFSGEPTMFSLAPADAKEGEGIPLAGAGWVARIERDIGIVPERYPCVLMPGDANCPHAMSDSMLTPFVGMAMRGVIWYQGESNADHPRNCDIYRELIGLMIRDWRHRWGEGDFPFIQVQLANYNSECEYRPDSPWSMVQFGQLMVTRDLPNVGMVSAIDVGMARDIHPKDKKTVGERLAQWAFANVYGFGGVSSGPGYLSAAVGGGKVRVTFSDVGGGLVSRNPDDPTLVRGCRVFDAKGKDYPAVGRIVGSALEISSDKVPFPRRACYAWSSNPKFLDLFNREGQPASPFMTE